MNHPQGGGAEREGVQGARGEIVLCTNSGMSSQVPLRVVISSIFVSRFAIKVKSCSTQTVDCGDKCCRCRRERQERAEERCSLHVTHFLEFISFSSPVTICLQGVGLAHSALASLPMAAS